MRISGAACVRAALARAANSRGGAEFTLSESDSCFAE